MRWSDARAHRPESVREFKAHTTKVYNGIFNVWIGPYSQYLLAGDYLLLLYYYIILLRLIINILLFLINRSVQH